MIAHVKGRLIEKTPTNVVVECNGVGYLLHISLYTYSRLGNEEHCMLHTHMAVREDAHTLYGFVDKEERQVFRQLISVSGVGANTARMILSSLSPAEVHNAIMNDNVDLLKSIKGIGAKSAQRIIVDLKDKLNKEEAVLQNISFSSGNTKKEEALSALLALGFEKAKSGKVLDKVIENAGKELSIEELIKQALRQL